jgi:TatD DNase family protein
MQAQDMRSSIERLSHLDKFRHLVVHCKRAPFDVYIGRDCKGMPPGCEARWGNPFVMKNQSEGERLRVTGEYERWVQSQPRLAASVRAELRGKVLACYCSPLMCHGNVLAYIANSDTAADVAEGALVQNTSTAQPTAALAVSGESSAAAPSKQQLKNRMRRQRKREAVAAVAAVGGGDAKPGGEHSEEAPESSTEVRKMPPASSCAGFVDVGINITNSQLKPHWKQLVAHALEANVSNIILTGTSVKNTEESIAIAHQWFRETGSRALHCTAGVHPHYAKTFKAETYNSLKELLKDPFVSAVGECGLDFNRNLSSKDSQIYAFREQVRLACEMKTPLFIHEREAHDDLVAVLDAFAGIILFGVTATRTAITDSFYFVTHIIILFSFCSVGQLPPIVIHCFTGTAAEVDTYVRRGYYIGFTGTLCKKERGAHLRELVVRVPLGRLMIETDAPYMGFSKTRRNSEPADVVQVAEQVANCFGVDVEVIREATTRNATEFFRFH